MYCIVLVKKRERGIDRKWEIWKKVNLNRLNRFLVDVGVEIIINRLW